MLSADVVVIGAGPAGMSAARTAAGFGASVAIVDEQRFAGGQIYRDVENASPKRNKILGKEYTKGAALAAGLKHHNINHLRDATVWSIEEDSRVAFTQRGEGNLISFKKLVLATGALERPFPVPGWTLPGVMSAGAGQILLKQSGLIAKSAVLVGSGPLLLLVAAQMIRAGAPPLALVETQTRADFLKAAKHLPGALKGWRYLLKGSLLLTEIIKAKVPRYTAAHGIRIIGDERAEGIVFKCGRRTVELPCESVFLHHGVIPHTQIARSVEVKHSWNELQKCFRPDVDEWGGTSVADIFCVGDSAGIGGANVAEHSGTLVSLKIAEELCLISADERDTFSQPARIHRAKELAIRPFLDTAYPAYAEALSPDDETIICRCEVKTAGDVRRYAELGCLGPNQAKSFGRVGMGPCQGRYCGPSVTALLAEVNGSNPDDTGYFRIRAPIKPITLSELAATTSHDEQLQLKEKT